MRPRPFHLVLLATAAVLLACVALLPHRELDPDELEHAHAAWLWFKGTVPYKDFFEHHTPWYYYALRPFFNWFDVDGSFDSARRFLVFGRALSLVPTVASVLLVWAIGRLWNDRRTGLVAGLLLVSQPFVIRKAVEMRPDVLALPFFLGALWLLLRGLERGTDSAARGLRWFLGAGLCLGGGVMCTQKMLFVLPGALAGLGIWSLSVGLKAARARILSAPVFLLGVCVPAVVTWAAFAAQQAGGDFIADNFLLNAEWKHTATHQLRRLLETSGPVLALGLLGVCLSLSRFVGSAPRRHGDLLLVCILVGLFVGVLVVPSAHRQYYLMPLPIICLFAAQGLFWIVERARERARAPLFALAAIALAVLPALALRDGFHYRNDDQLAKLRQVFETTRPTDVVMDGWQGMGVFRPHAFRYFFLHEETRAMLPRPRWDAYMDALENGTIRPRLIVMDENLAAMGPRFLAFVHRNYVSRDGFFYFARGGA